MYCQQNLRCLRSSAQHSIASASLVPLIMSWSYNDSLYFTKHFNNSITCRSLTAARRHCFAVRCPSQSEWFMNGIRSPSVPIQGYSHGCPFSLKPSISRRSVPHALAIRFRKFINPEYDHWALQIILGLLLLKLIPMRVSFYFFPRYDFPRYQRRALATRAF